MRWWNLEAAKNELKAGQISSQQLFSYLLGFVIFEAAILNFAFFSPAGEEPGTLQYIFACVDVLVSAIGAYYVYRKNGGATGRFFLERFLIVGWVAGIRFGAVMIIVMSAWFFLAICSWPNEEVIFAGDILSTFVMLAYYCYFGHHIGDVATQNSVA